MSSNIHPPSLQSRLYRLMIRCLAGPFFYGNTPLCVQRLFLAGINAIPPSGVRAEAINDGVVRGEWLYPRHSASNAVVLYLHGGAYCLGSAATHRNLAGHIANAVQARVFVLNYRLAPEHPCPAAVHDTIAAYCWLLAQDVHGDQIVLAGDSAGGGLAVAATVALRDSGKPLPAAIVCLSAWTDLACTGHSLITRANADPVLQPPYVKHMARFYVGELDPYNSVASPLYAELHGLPPMLFQVGRDEVLLDDSIRLAERARTAGVDCTLDIWDGMWHVWQIYGDYMPESRQAIDSIGAFIRQHLIAVDDPTKDDICDALH